MKLLENNRLSALTSFLTSRSVGDRVINGRVEAFSCKRAGEDKKLSKKLEQQYADELSTSPQGVLGSSPLGAMSESATRKLLIDLISTLNASFPDHDFSALRPEEFCRERNADLVARATNRHLAEIATQQAGVLEELWAAIDDAAGLRDCEVFSYVPDYDSDPFSEGVLWSFNYFFFNKTLKRIVYLSCVAKSAYTNASPTECDYDDGFRIENDDHLHPADEIMVMDD